MSTPRPGMAGATRTCPHCKTLILESASVCPACRHHLRFDEASRIGSTTHAVPPLVPFRVEGHVHHPADSGPWEYTVVLSIRNDRGEEINRQVVGVGAMQPGEQRAFQLSVEMFPRSPAGKPRR